MVRGGDGTGTHEIDAKRGFEMRESYQSMREIKAILVARW